MSQVGPGRPLDLLGGAFMALTYAEITQSRSAMIKVVLQAAFDLGEPGEIQVGARALRRDKALNWFLSENESEGSFRWFCHHLAMDPDWYAEKVQAGEYSLYGVDLGMLPDHARQVLEEKDVSVRQASRELGVSPSAIRNIIRGNVASSRIVPMLADYIHLLEASG